MTEPSEAVAFPLFVTEHAAEQTAAVPLPVEVAARPTAGAWLVPVHVPGTAPPDHPRLLDGTPVLIGRDPACGVCLAHESVSRRHAGIERVPDGGYHVIDLGSRNGTAVNGVRVPAAVLRDGDRVRVGEFEFRFVAGTDQAAQPAAGVDPVTGTLNRRAVDEVLEREVARSARHARPLSLLLIGLDGFEDVNDRHGRAAGDCVLRAAAGVIGDVFRVADVVARYGGDVFAVVLPETPADLAFICGNRVRQALDGHPFAPGGAPVSLTVSGGIGEWGPGVTVAELVGRAEARLYEAKRLGRNRIRR